MYIAKRNITARHILVGLLIALATTHLAEGSSSHSDNNVHISSTEDEALESEIEHHNADKLPWFAKSPNKMYVAKPNIITNDIQEGLPMELGTRHLAVDSSSDSDNENHTASKEEKDEEEEVEEEIEPHYAVLFPWFVEAIGLIVYYFLSRYARWLPYTGVMFAIGAFMGVGALENTSDHSQLTVSINQWSNINSEVLLLIFLPGLVFRDAYGLNTYLFSRAFGQCVLMAFPMVLASTMLTAMVPYYILPYEWGWNLCATFGSILAATDPVAVAVLLNEVGAPARLQTHIGGEALLNDGSAIVFFTIFSGMFYAELGIKGLGASYTVGGGFLLFFWMSLVGALIGLAFGFALLMVFYLLNRRLNFEESVVNVSATVTVAYVCYYVADSIAGTSGVIAVVACGVVSSHFGSSIMASDEVLMDSFWILVEHLLNTLLFALGGVVWGNAVSVGMHTFGARQWYCLFAVYAFAIVIRFFLVFAFYPILARIGLGSSWQEALFMSWGGLRGAVGITLALALDNKVSQVADDEHAIFRNQTKEVLVVVGGIAFLTLMINATTAGPLLMKLNLTKMSDARKRMIDDLFMDSDKKMVDDFVALMSDPRFHEVKFAMIRGHIPGWDELKLEDLHAATKRYLNEKKPSQFNPYLAGIVPEVRSSVARDSQDEEAPHSVESMTQAIQGERRVHLVKNMSYSGNRALDLAGEVKVKELRKAYIELLRIAYIDLIKNGEIDSRSGFTSVPLLQSLNIVSDQVSRGEPLKDWDAVQIGHVKGDRLYVYLNHLRQVFKGKPRSTEDLKKSYKATLALALIEAHRVTLERFKHERVEEEDEYSTPEYLVAEESKRNVDSANKALEDIEEDELRAIVSRVLCKTILMKAAHRVEHMHSVGLITEQEAAPYLTKIEKAFLKISSDIYFHPQGNTQNDSPSVGLSMTQY